MTTEPQTIEDRLDDMMERLGQQIPALAEKFTPYQARPGGVPLGLALERASVVFPMITLAQISLGDQLGDQEAQQVLASIVNLADGAKDPFNSARNAQLSVSPARWQIEQHLNALSQGGIEQLADALNQGGTLFARLRK